VVCPPFSTPFSTVDHELAREGVTGPLSEKAHDIRCAEAGDGGMDEVLVDTFEIDSGLEQDTQRAMPGAWSKRRVNASLSGYS
jgi:hypothetical protein